MVRWLVRAAGVAVVLVAGSPAAAQDRVLGLLSLPEVFGNGACDRFTPSDVVLHAGPDSLPAIGRIRVDRYWTFHDGGGCEGLVVNVHRTGTSGVRPFPTREQGYEEPAAVVLDQRGQWFKVRLADGAAWLLAASRDEFRSLESLLADGATYLTEAAIGPLVSVPGGVARTGASSVAAERAVQVNEFRQVDGTLWLRIEVLRESPCVAADPPVIDRGWIRAHAASGEPTVWFRSRGC